MGKSLRAKDRVKARNDLREKVFGPVEKQRLLNAVESLHEKNKQGKDTDGEEAMQVDDGDKKVPKVSTSGWKGSRSDWLRKAGGKNKKKKNQLIFKSQKKKK